MPDAETIDVRPHSGLAGASNRMHETAPKEFVAAVGERKPLVTAVIEIGNASPVWLVSCGHDLWVASKNDYTEVPTMDVRHFEREHVDVLELSQSRDARLPWIGVGVGVVVTAAVVFVGGLLMGNILYGAAAILSGIGAYLVFVKLATVRVLIEGNGEEFYWSKGYAVSDEEVRSIAETMIGFVRNWSSETSVRNDEPGENTNGA